MRWLGNSFLPPGRGNGSTCSASGSALAKPPMKAELAETLAKFHAAVAARAANATADADDDEDDDGAEDEDEAGDADEMDGEEGEEDDD